MNCKPHKMLYKITWCFWSKIKSKCSNIELFCGISIIQYYFRLRQVSSILKTFPPASYLGTMFLIFLWFDFSFNLRSLLTKCTCWFDLSFFGSVNMLVAIEQWKSAFTGMNYTHWRKLKKIHSQFCFLCSCWRNKIAKNTDVSLWARADYLNFPLQCACDRKTLGSHLNSLFE